MMENKRNSENYKKAFETVSTYASDRPLFNALGLKPFNHIALNKEYYVGEV